MKKLLILLFLLPLLLTGLETTYDLTNAVGYWSLGQNDAVSTAIFDLSGEKNDGTSANTPVFIKDQNNTPNQAQVYNGTSDKVTVGNVGNIKTFAIWIYPTAHTRSIADFDGGTISVEIDASSDITATGWTAPTVYVNGSVASAITLNAWNYIAVTSATAVNASALVIGNEATWFAGNLSDHFVYSDEKSSTFLSSQYLAGQTTTGIVADGTNLVTNGTFDTDSDWNKYTGWTISGGTANCDGSQTGWTNLSQTVFEIDKTYLVSFNITSISAGGVYPLFMGAISIETTIGSYSYTGVATSVTLNMHANVDFTGSIDNVVVTDITNQQVSTLSQNLAFDMPMTPKITRSSPTIDSGSLTIGRKYVITARDGEDFTADGSPDNNVGTIFVATGTNVTLDANDTVKELNATTLDLSSNANHGTVSGATVTYDGLVNAGAGIAYIPSTTISGVWEFNFFGANTGYDIGFFCINTATPLNTQESYFIRVDGTIIRMLRGDPFAGVWATAASYLTASTNYRIRIEYTEAGIFTSYIRGGEFGWDDWTLIDVSGGSGINPIANTVNTVSNYFVIDSGVGDIISDLHINGKPISLSDATQSTGTWATTKPSYYYAGSGEWITSDVYNSIQDNTTGTISCWINKDALSAKGMFTVSDGTGNNILLFGIYSAGEVWIRSKIGGATKLDLFSDVDITALPWYHITITQNGTAPAVYINGELVAHSYVSEVDKTIWFSDITISLAEIGTAVTGNEWDGYLAEMRIWSEVRSTTEIMQEYNRKKSIYQ